MSNLEDSGPAGDGDDLLAAEYVLGVLPAEERRAAAARLERDASFARLAERWEAHLAPLAESWQLVEPPEWAKAAIDRRLFQAGPGPAPVAAASGIWQSLALWRGLAGAALAALALMVALPWPERPVPAQRSQLVASLAASGSEVRYLAVYDAASDEVALRHVSGERAPGSDFELWMIEGSNAPVSMGVIPSGTAVRLPVAPAAKAKLDSGDVLAVSVEPAGGSPSGQPTGPVVAAGDLQGI
jgi:anti-sigma-K factor RskA